MGYDISVPFKTEAEKNAMKQFLTDNQDILQDLYKTNMFPPHSIEILEKDEMGYAPSKAKHLLGFHGTGIPKYLWTLCSWMAVKSTVRTKKDEIYFYYDSEKMFVEINPTTATKNMRVDAQGVELPNQKETSFALSLVNFMDFMAPNTDKSRELVEALSIKWEARELQNKLIKVESKNSTLKNKI